MTPDNNNKPGENKPGDSLPSTGEGADSALDVLKKKRGQLPPSDPTVPLHSPPPKK